MISPNPASSHNRPALSNLPGGPVDNRAPQIISPVGVTGAAGLLGGELLRELQHRDIPVRGTDRHSPTPEEPATDLTPGDLLDPATCRRICEGLRTLIHAAALQHGPEMPSWGRRRFFDQNIVMTRNLIDAALRAGVEHVVFVSSDMVYGIPRAGPFTELDEPRPIGPYGCSKLASESICLACRERGIAVTILRPRLILGRGRLGILKKLFECVRNNRPIPMLGDGRTRYQMVSVADVARACLLAIEERREGIYNLGSNDPPPVRELLTELCNRSGSKSRLLALPSLPSRIALWGLHLVRLGPMTPEQFRIADVDYVLDTSRASARLGWEPRDHDGDMLFEAYQSYLESR